MEEQKTTLIQDEIAAELLNAGTTTSASRKQFVLHDFDTPHDREMAVFTATKKLAQYIFVICEKSPKKFRWSIITRLQNAAVDAIEFLYRANFERGVDERIAHQKSALVSLNLVDFFADTARSNNAISLHQMSVIGKQLVECKKLLNGWVKATKK